MTSDGKAGSFIFAPEKNTEKAIEENVTPWFILIVDDEESIHQITELTLNQFKFANKPVEFLHAYTGTEACEILSKRRDVAIVLLDVVMESDDAGLKAVDVIRNNIGNKNVRVILRTGQPGQAPETRVIEEYDINGYSEKTELTAKKLHSIVYTALRSYRDIVALDNHRKGLEKVIDATATILKENDIKNFAQGALEQLAALLYIEDDIVLLKYEGIVARHENEDDIHVLAMVGSDNDGKKTVEAYSDLKSIKAIKAQGESSPSIVQEAVKIAVENPDSKLITEKDAIKISNYYNGKQLILYIQGSAELHDVDLSLIELFCRNIAIALENIELYQENQDTQKEIIYSVCDLAESRSKETGNHVKRVALYSKLLAKKYGLSDDECEELFYASPLHDIGKVAIPDSILNKPGPLDPEEWEVMKTHAEIGQQILTRINKPIFIAGRRVAGEHHENWDGSGYPNGLKGKDIHVYGRITAIADVFDALMSKRCYKPAWTLEKVIDFIVEQKGTKFEPELVDLFIAHQPEFVNIFNEYNDVIS